MKLFIDQIFEAIVISVNYADGTCSISPMSAAVNAPIDDVPIPYIAGAGAGIFLGFGKNTRVIVAKTSGSGQEISVIIGYIPDTKLLKNNFNSSKPVNIPAGTTAYPDMTDGKVVLRSAGGAKLDLGEDGNVMLGVIAGAGIFLKRNSSKSASYIVSEDHIHHTNSGRSISGVVRRIPGISRNLSPRRSLVEAPLFVDDEYHITAEAIGLFGGSRVSKYTFGGRKRNPALSEYRQIFNEFSTDSMFTGFNDEVDRVKQEKSLFENSETFLRNREPTNSLHLAEHELLEVIIGNVVDLNGEVYDINYRPIVVGAAGGKVPSSNEQSSYDDTRRKSRRGIGYHLRLSTNVNDEDPSTTNSSFVMDVDKEGILKVNIPASSDTGNIMFVSDSDFAAAGDTISTTQLQPSREENIPVTLMSKDGVNLIPGESTPTGPTRRTGIRYSNEKSYFPSLSDDGEIRINSTKYHNMYAIAERLIANSVESFKAGTYINDEGGVDQLGFDVPFEILALEEDSDNDGAVTETPRFSSVIVAPLPPAIYTGGSGNDDLIVAGQLFGDEVSPVSNDFGTEDRSSGGQSVNANLEGSMEMSVGADNVDGKSVVLDTAGSLLAWFGADKNNRSVVMQTDGDMLINIGGSYNGNSTMNSGNLNIRINLVDKKFVGTEFSVNESGGDLSALNGGNPGSESDIMLSFGKEGVIIACDARDVPMVLRNRHDIVIESTEGKVKIKGTDVELTGSKQTVTVGSLKSTQ